MKDTLIDAKYYHKVVDCQWACPAHTPVPQYIRMIQEKRYADAYLVNWQSNRFPGILGRICDRPCEPACRRSRVEEKAVAICRLKRVAADYKGNITAKLPKPPPKNNGKKIALIGAGPASLTTASDLALLGYNCEIFEKESAAGGAIRYQVPKFRLPEKVLNEELQYIWDLGIKCHFNHEVKSLESILDKNFDAVFIGTGSPLANDLDIPGRNKIPDDIELGLEFLASIAFGHKKEVKENIVVIGGGNTAMDCARSSLRLGAKSVSIISPESFDKMLASPWEKEDALKESIKFTNDLLPHSFVCKDNKLSGILFKQLKQCYDTSGNWNPVYKDEKEVFVVADQVILAIGQKNSFPFINSDEINVNDNNIEVNPSTLQTIKEGVFVGGDAAFGPKNMIEAVAHGHKAAISIDLYCQKKSIHKRPSQSLKLLDMRMGINQWAYDNSYKETDRQEVPSISIENSKNNIDLEVEVGFDKDSAIKEAKRCLNCDIQTVLSPNLCIECDACIDVCPTSCLTITEPEKNLGLLKTKLTRPSSNSMQDLLIATVPQTKNIMVKDEDLCIHCGLCAERCPTEAWSMKEFSLLR